MANPSDPPDVAKTIARYSPVSLPPEVAAFARTVVAAAEPKSAARAKALLFAAGRLGTFATSVGLELDPSVVLHPSLIERFIIVATKEMSLTMRRTLRSNLRRPGPGRHGQHGPGSCPPLARSGQGPVRAVRDLCLPGPGRRPADAGPTHAPLGVDRVGGRGGVDGIRPARRLRARVVPLLARYHERALASASFAGAGYVIGGFSAQRRNVTADLKASVAGGADLPVLDTGRLRATWLVEGAASIGLKAFMDAAGITCSQRLGDLVATLAARTEREMVALLGGAP